MGILFIVSTPIGNLEDITLRALRIMSEVDVIACEDTRKTGLLLQNLPKITNLISGRVGNEAAVSRRQRPKFLSYYEKNEVRRIPQIINLLKEGNKVALVTNAGTPMVSDPGFRLVRECIRQSIKVEAIPGASAILTALVVSGLPPDRFLFLGYLPKKQGKRKRLLKNLLLRQNMKSTVVLFEAPHRLIKTLVDLQVVLGDMEIVICRELTKIHEEVRREKISQSIVHFEKVKPKGELTLLFRLSRFRISQKRRKD
jgi:16S rRNA (cytidine1402-2'-O)-methyltransferase